MRSFAKITAALALPFLVAGASCQCPPQPDSCSKGFLDTIGASVDGEYTLYQCDDGTVWGSGLVRGPGGPFEIQLSGEPGDNPDITITSARGDGFISTDGTSLEGDWSMTIDGEPILGGSYDDGFCTEPRVERYVVIAALKNDPSGFLDCAVIRKDQMHSGRQVAGPLSLQSAHEWAAQECVAYP